MHLRRGLSPLLFIVMIIHLSPRLQAVAELVDQDARVIDVGTDHAMIPVWLVQTGRAVHVLATDIRSGPLENAAALVARTGAVESIRLLQTDGLTDIGPENGDTVIIAGMGGETIISILSAAPWTKENVRLILSPQSKKEDLRRYLTENGYCIHREQLVKDAGRVYPILCARGGTAPKYTRAELNLGLLSQIGSDPLFAEYLDIMRGQTAKAAPYDDGARTLLTEYDEIKRRLTTCRP